MPFRLNKEEFTGSEIYKFASNPSLINFAEPEERKVYYGSLIADRRVRRGNTWSKTPLKPRKQAIETSTFSKYKYRSLLKPLKKSLGSPEVFKPRFEVDTSLYLVADDRVQERKEGFTSVDEFVRTKDDTYTLRKTGQDKQSQIYDGDLFMFEQEVMPVIRVIVGKVKEQAESEVIEEEALFKFRYRQRQLEEKRNAEIEDERKLERLAKLQEQKKRLMITRKKKHLAEQKEAADKIAALAFSQKFFENLVPSTLKVLKVQGYFYDPTRHNIEKGFFADLMKDCDKLNNLARPAELCKKDITSSQLSRIVFDKIIRNIAEERLEAYEVCPPLISFENDFCRKCSLEIPTIEENLASVSQATDINKKFDSYSSTNIKFKVDTSAHNLDADKQTTKEEN